MPHQANIRIMDLAAQKLGIPKEKFYINIDRYGNTSSASIPIALDEMNPVSYTHLQFQIQTTDCSLPIFCCFSANDE